MSSAAANPASLEQPVYQAGAPAYSTAIAELLPPLVTSGIAIDGISYRDRLITRPALANWLHISPHRLGIWAKTGYGPIPRRCGGYKCYYVVGEVLDFLAASLAAVCPDVRRTKKTITSPKV
jgi:hypothetical protein